MKNPLSNGTKWVIGASNDFGIRVIGKGLHLWQP